LELQLDVIDDLFGEAEEIHKVNPWLCYSQHFHRLREFGVSFKELDMIDEKLLTMEQMRRVLTLIYGKESIDKLPLPEVDFPGFCRGIEHINQNEFAQDHVWSPITRKVSDWVDVKQLKKSYGPGTCCCFCC
jgi:hypothetical protein